ncbi:MAG: large conductance mechanosensitive channel protein MscL [Candidatus Harrisonbacteria bacterium CG10_big_fil_rev_8_21_14_0_10_45_28]|uniref:Large-conductance mechanosensitive channel n=1 Tax=Candidatus Harrisonbacteria bacterium CG10_big_fil_rev_8_21_14_0_10_45_28 TaxID=1974586 RepID=A0A2H0UNG0_9BACT|nr:MAG: large conductance mechanosensitive channel protein MscL [Candidatus Harrisonbacteria bacterium CG10_big_fil_rev_8_21_14_0_10_45_28]
MKNFFSEFKEFAIKGNILDLSIGVIIGGAFGKIISSFVNDLVLAPLSFVVGKANFTDYFLTLSGGDFATLAEAKTAGAITLNYGSFLTQVVDFLILALIIFLVVRQINRFRRKKETI